jgi:hypothetical protein
MRDRLFPICDITKLAARRRSLLLKNDPDTFLRIAFTFYIDSRLSVFLRSPYSQAFLQKLVLDSHKGLVKALPQYSEFFEQDDPLFLVDLAVDVITEVLDHVPKVTIRDLDYQNIMTTILSQAIQLIDKIWPALCHQLEDPVRLEALLAIRDKLWYTAREIAKLFVPQALSHILATLQDEKTKQDYLRVYLSTIDFYLEKFLTETFTRKIREATEHAKVPWKESYNNLGSVFRPPETVRPGMVLDTTTRNNPVMPQITVQTSISKGAGTARGEKSRA